MSFVCVYVFVSIVLLVCCFRNYSGENLWGCNLTTLVCGNAVAVAETLMAEYGVQHGAESVESLSADAKQVGFSTVATHFHTLIFTSPAITQKQHRNLPYRMWRRYLPGRGV